MFKQRNKFLTIIFSLVPGAGHMFMGFMKKGLSLMVMFFLIIFLATWQQIGPLIFIIPILVFYSFFDCINKSFANPEEFAQLEDRFFFSNSKSSIINGILNGKGRLIAGILIIIIGCDFLLNSITNSYPIQQTFPRIYRIITALMSTLPQFVTSFVIIAIGAYLIIGKKRRDNNNG